MSRTETAPAKSKDLTPQSQFRDQLQHMNGEIASALPPHIPPERFIRIVLTAVNGNPDLLSADRRSLFEAAMKAAQDGLLPDGRDGAFVVFKAKSGDSWIKKVQWMPMVGGILKKIRNSGELLSIAAHVVYEADKFEYILGDEERIEHAPALHDRGRPIAVYAIAKTKDGGIYREVMSIDDVEKVRNVSRAKDSGPWVNWWDEMSRKTVIRRLAKRLPMSSDLDDLIRRDDELYDFSGQRAERPEPAYTVIENPLSDDVPAKQIEASPAEPEQEVIPVPQKLNSAGNIFVEYDKAFAGCKSEDAYAEVLEMFAGRIDALSKSERKTADAIAARHLERVMG